MKEMSADEFRQHVAHARATVAGPDLLAAVAPVADRIRRNIVYQNRGHHPDAKDTMALVVSIPEARAILAAVEKGTDGIR